MYTEQYSMVQYSVFRKCKLGVGRTSVVEFMCDCLFGVRKKGHKWKFVPRLLSKIVA